jgi:hypothetical protein
MKLMKKKMIGLFICMLLVATIPLAAGMTDHTDNTTGTTALKKTIMFGIVANSKVTGRLITFRAVWIHYRVIGGGQTGKIIGQKVTIENQGMFRLNPPMFIGLVDGEPKIGY